MAHQGRVDFGSLDLSGIFAQAALMGGEVQGRRVAIRATSGSKADVRTCEGHFAALASAAQGRDLAGVVAALKGICAVATTDRTSRVAFECAKAGIARHIAHDVHSLKAAAANFARRPVVA